MATQWTAGLTALSPLPAATLNTIGAAWEAWTPTWTSGGTQPSLGNGQIGGRYCRVNKLVIAEAFLVMGSTTTYGTGGYVFSLPIVGTNLLSQIGTASLLDASAGYIAYTGNALYNGASGSEWRLGAASGVWTATFPFTLAVNDQIRFSFFYEAA